MKKFKNQKISNEITILKWSFHSSYVKYSKIHQIIRFFFPNFLPHLNKFLEERKITFYQSF